MLVAALPFLSNPERFVDVPPSPVRAYDSFRDARGWLAVGIQL
jgi:hypothetical protein